MHVCFGCRRVCGVPEGARAHSLPQIDLDSYTDLREKGGRGGEREREKGEGETERERERERKRERITVITVTSSLTRSQARQTMERGPKSHQDHDACMPQACGPHTASQCHGAGQHHQPVSPGVLSTGTNVVTALTSRNGKERADQ